MRGDQVIVRAFRGRLVVRTVWAETATMVYVCTEEAYDLLTKGINVPEPIGVPRETVYVYDPAILSQGTENSVQDDAFWNSLRMWRPLGGSKDDDDSDVKRFPLALQQMLNRPIA